MTIASIYSNHYPGETYRFAVAYLRARSPKNHRAPRQVGPETLDEQRRIIAQYAKERRAIIVAEFIDYGDPRRGERHGFERLRGFAARTRVPEVFVVHHDYIDWRHHGFTAKMHRLYEHDIAVRAVYEE